VHYIDTSFIMSTVSKEEAAAAAAAATAAVAVVAAHAHHAHEPIKGDIWRSAPLRYAGYCNEVGEAFAPIYPKFLIPSYVVSVLYVLGDTASKTNLEHCAQKEKINTPVK
jgi:hypothetical protein